VGWIIPSRLVSAQAILPSTIIGCPAGVIVGPARIVHGPAGAALQVVAPSSALTTVSTPGSNLAFALLSTKPTGQGAKSEGVQVASPPAVPVKAVPAAGVAFFRIGSSGYLLEVALKVTAEPAVGEAGLKVKLGCGPISTRPRLLNWWLG